MSSLRHIITASSLAETMKVRRQQDNVFKLLKDKKCQPEILHMTVAYFKNEGKTKTFPDKQKMVFINNNLPYRKSFRLKEMNTRHNLKTYEEIKSTGKSTYMSKHKSQCY